MIHGTFREPNFRCRVHDDDDNHYEWLTHAESEGDLQQRLEDHGYLVDAIEPYDLGVFHLS